jgi:hypothetical protein
VPALSTLSCPQSLPVPHQALLFSATMPKEIESLASQYLVQPVKIKIGRVSVPTANVAQSLERTNEGEKMRLLVDLLLVGGGKSRAGGGVEWAAEVQGDTGYHCTCCPCHQLAVCSPVAFLEHLCSVAVCAVLLNARLAHCR